MDKESNGSDHEVDDMGPEDPDAPDNNSKAYAELGRRGPASDSLVNAADKMTHDADEARILAASKLAREKRDARISDQRAVNAEGMAEVRKALDLPSAEADPLAGHSKGARRTLDAARIKGERDRNEHQAALAAQAAREWPKDQLIETPDQARKLGRQLADERAQAKQAEEARGIIDKQAE